MANDILIVDDEADIRELVAGILDDEGFKSRTARDSDTAVAEISARRLNLIFLDIWIQEAGSTACKCLSKSSASTRKCLWS